MTFLVKIGLFLPILTVLGLNGCGGTLATHQPVAEPTTEEPRQDPAGQPLPAPREGSRSTGLAQQPTAEQTTGEPVALSPSAPSALWERIRQGYRLPIRDKPRVQREVNWYASHPDYLTRIQERARPYLYFIVKETEKRDLPLELALLPIVESAFQPFAYSPGRAAGLWQFIPSTGKLYGLKQNWWYDGRRDVVAATHAALDYLQSLADQFDGNWELALASYNSGAGTVRNAIRSNKKRGKPTDFWTLDLPRETEGYVPRLLAIAQVIENPAKYGLSLSPLPNQPFFGTVNIEGQLDLALAAEMAEISIEELYRLNPGFNRWATDPQGPHRLNLPLEKIEGFSEQLAQLDPKSRVKWERYQIRSGDNLGSIARKYGTTIGVLQQANQLKGNRIRAGRHLLIPVSTRHLNHYALSTEQRQTKLQNTQRGGSKTIHRVLKGDTLWDISRSHQVGPNELARWNGMSPKDTLQPGQKLVVWSRNGSRLNTALPNSNPLIKTRSSVRYRVRKGDSLHRIANRFNVTVTDLRKWNTLSGRYLKPGQRLQLYVDVREQTL